MKLKHFVFIALGLLLVVPIVIHTVFYFPAFCEWAEAKEIEGSIITYAGTVTLGLVSLYQTVKANKLSSDLISIQKSKDTPAVIISAFLGISKNSRMTIYKSFDDSELLMAGIIEGRDKDNNVELLYSLEHVIDNDFDENKKIYTRAYEFHFENCSCQTISSFSIKQVYFHNEKVKKDYIIPNFPAISLPANEKIRMTIFLFSNYDFTEDGSSSNAFIQSGTIEFDTSIGIIGNETPFYERIILNKHLVKEPEAQFNRPMTEKMVSVFIDMKER